jgi:non-specific serine/threonine protein kinase
MTETLVDTLRPKALLLVLDNCEHLLAACGDLAVALLRSCPHLRIVATSREGLGVPGETLWRVPSLSLPDADHLPLPEDLVLYEAVRLFVDRAVATAPGFTVTRMNAPAVAAVCQRLDGIPLAIELAAARVKVLAVEQIATRLDDRFRLLTGGSRMLVPRQQTLRATLDWSYGLLSEQERSVLRRLSVFAGGLTLEAAEAVCAGGGIEASDILDLLTRLVDKSLVIAETQGGEARYRLLETVRQYGRDRIAESNEAAVVRKKHRDWCLDLAGQAEPKLRGPEQKTWVDRLETEHDNFRAALAWSSTDPASAEAGLRLAGLLWWFWYVGGHAREGRQWLDGALARSADAPPTAMPAAILGAMNFAAFQNDSSRVTELGAQGLAVCRQVGDRRNMALLLAWLGSAARREGDYERGTALLQDSMAIARELRDKWTIGLALGHLGIIARLQGDADRATALHAESLALSKEMGYASHIAFNLGLLCDDALYQDDYARAGDYCIEGLKLSQQLGHRSFTRDFLESAAAVARGQGLYERAARLLGAASALRETIGDYRSPLSETAFKKRIVSTRNGLGDSAFDEAWAEGRAMTLEQAIEYAMKETE